MKVEKEKEGKGKDFLKILLELFSNSYLNCLSLAVKGYSFNLERKFAVNKLKLLW